MRMVNIITLSFSFSSLIIVIIGCIIYDITVKFELLIVHKFCNEVLRAFFSPCD